LYPVRAINLSKFIETVKYARCSNLCSLMLNLLILAASDIT